MAFIYNDTNHLNKILFYSIYCIEKNYFRSEDHLSSEDPNS